MSGEDALGTPCGHMWGRPQMPGRPCSQCLAAQLSICRGYRAKRALMRHLCRTHLYAFGDTPSRALHIRYKNFKVVKQTYAGRQGRPNLGLTAHLLLLRPRTYCYRCAATLLATKPASCVASCRIMASSDRRLSHPMKYSPGTGVLPPLALGAVQLGFMAALRSSGERKDEKHSR